MDTVAKDTVAAEVIMHNPSSPASSRIRAARRVPGRALMVAAALSAAATTLPLAAQAADDVDECVDAAWAEYNRCLVDSSWWTIKLCDFSFLGRYLACLQIEM